MPKRRRRFPSFFDAIFRRMMEEMERGIEPIREWRRPREKRFFEPFEEMIRGFEERIPEKFEKFVREEETPSGKVRKFGPFIYGFSYSKMPGEEPELVEFGNVRPGEPGKIEPAPKGEREPIADVVDLEDMYEVTMELPGAERDEIDLTATENTMKVKTTGERKYRKEITFDEPINPEKIDANFKAGILTAEVDKREKGEGRKINIK